MHLHNCEARILEELQKLEGETLMNDFKIEQIEKEVKMRKQINIL